MEIDKLAGPLGLKWARTDAVYLSDVFSGVPTGVAVSADGSIYVSSDIENAIYQFPPEN
ncbi:hypothetical protein KKI24_09995 [bacterium]|nr:hypothetical protein [bacterium]